MYPHFPLAFLPQTLFFLNKYEHTKLAATLLMMPFIFKVSTYHFSCDKSTRSKKKS